jgi:hypothetical protein
MPTVIAAIWFSTWILVAIVGAMRVLIRNHTRQTAGAFPTSVAAQRRLIVGIALFVLLFGDVISVSALQHFVTHPTISDGAVILLVGAVLLVSAWQLLTVS